MTSDCLPHQEVRLVLASSTYAGVVVFNETLWHEETPPALSSFARGRVFGLVSSDMALPLEMALDAGVHFHAMENAENNLRLSGWSASSEACSVTSTQFNPLWIYLILWALVLALILCMYCIYKSNLGKILAPNLRKREKREERRQGGANPDEDDRGAADYRQSLYPPGSDTSLYEYDAATFWHVTPDQVWYFRPDLTLWYDCRNECYYTYDSSLAEYVADECRVARTLHPEDVA
jgi:hypothetical protein